jgi:DNA-binding beta-propeller fold protein YncE
MVLAGPAVAQELGAFRQQIDGLHDPRGVALGADGAIYVADTDDGSVRVLDSDGSARAVWSVGGAPHGLAIGPDGRLVVSDRDGCRILVLDRTGAVEHAFGGHGVTPGRFDRPAGVHWRDGSIYVADSGNDRIQVLDETGSHQLSVGSRGREPGELLGPMDVAVDDGGNVYVADTGNHRIQKFDTAGGALAQWGERGTFAGLLISPCGVVVHGDEVLVADGLGHRIQAFDRQGGFRYLWGRHAMIPREGQGKIHYPSAIAIAPDGQTVVVAEAFENRVQVFGRIAPGTPPSPEFPIGKESHFGPLIDTDGRLLGVWEPESSAVVALDLRRDVPASITEFGEFGWRHGQFVQPGALLVQGTSFFVSDRVTQRLQEFRLDVTLDGVLRYSTRMARFVRSRQLEPPPETDPRIDAVAMQRDRDGSLYVLDAHACRVLVYDQELRPARQWGGFGTGDGQLRAPTDLALDHEAGTVLVVDAGNHRVQVFDPDGGFRHAFGRRGDGPGDFRRPYGVAVGRDGSVSVTDRGADRVVRFDRAGRFLEHWGETGSEPGQLWKPAGIVDDEEGRLILVDLGNHRLQVYALLDGRWQWQIAFDLGGGTLNPATRAENADGSR